MSAGPARARASIRAAITVCVSALWLTLGACGSDPFHLDWTQGFDTVRLYSITNPRPGLDDAFDFVHDAPVVLESIGATGSWDVALGGDENGLYLLPTGALGVSSTAGIAVVPGPLDGVLRAPTDSTAYERSAPVPLVTGSTYVIRTRRAYDYYGTTLCVFYAKMEPLAIDPEARRVLFIYGANPNCEDADLEP